MWSMLQIQSADKVASDFFSDKDDVFYKSGKIIYILTATVLMFSCGILFFGVAMVIIHYYNK